MDEGGLKEQLKRSFSLSDGVICCLLSGLNSLKPLLHLGKRNYTDLHPFGKGGSIGMALSMESGNRNRTG